VFSRHGRTITNAQPADLPSTATLAGGMFASVRGPHGALDVSALSRDDVTGEETTVCRQRLALVRLSPRTAGRRARRKVALVTE
jgi:hypothetical protein